MSLEVFTQQILPIKHKLYRFSLKIVGNSPEAEDVVQEVFIKLWNQREEWSNFQNLEAWCMRLTKNLSIDKLRSKHRRAGQISEQMDFVAPTVLPDRQTELKDSINKVHEFIGQLPQKQKLVIQLRDVEGHSYQEIAEILEIPMNQVKVYLFRARQSIKKQLIKSDTYGL